ncbi:GNAT family N-acetyltransferase [Chloroflexota bacterium]
MDNEIIIRESTTNDIKPLYELLQRTFEVSYKDVYPQEAIDRFKGRYSEDFILELAAEGYTVVAEYNGEIIGTGNLHENSIRQVYINPSHQNTGTGKLIVDELERKAIDNKLDSVEIGASLVSKEFWDARGFILDKEEAFPIENNQELRFFRMSKKFQ